MAECLDSLERLGRKEEALKELALIQASSPPPSDNPWARLEYDLLRHEAEAIFEK